MPGPRCIGFPVSLINEVSCQVGPDAPYRAFSALSHEGFGDVEDVQSVLFSSSVPDDLMWVPSCCIMP